MDIKRYDFNYRVAEVMPMLEEKKLYGTMSLIRDLKMVVDEVDKIRESTIDELAEKICVECGKNSLPVVYNGIKADFITLDMTMEIIMGIAQELKAGGE